MRHHAVTIILLLLILTTHSYSQQRTLEISGIRIYTEEELFDILELQRYEDGTMSAKEVTDGLISFYSRKGYSLVKIYVIENTDTSLKIFIDEGSLGKIIFLNMDDFTTIYLKITFRLKHKVFNINAVNEHIEKLKKGSRWKNITWQLKPVKEFSSSPFQLDRQLDLPLIGKTQLPFFDRYSPRYDLVVIFSKNVISEAEATKIISASKNRAKRKEAKGTIGTDKKPKKRSYNKLDYGLGVHLYRGFIPFLKYYHLGLISNGDFFWTDTSLGVMYGIDRQFTRPPRITFYQLSVNYFFTPTFKDIFTPHMKLDLYYSKTARPDIGLQQYHFMIIDYMLAPGITLLKKINMYTGVGVESAIFFQNKVFNIKLYEQTLWISSWKHNPTPLLTGEVTYDFLKNYRDLVGYNLRKKQIWREKDPVRVDVHSYIEAGIAYDFSKKRTKVYELRKNRLKKEIALLYNFYFLEKGFNKLRIIGQFEHEFKDRNIYSGALLYQYTFITPPFYQESSVTNIAFKGLTGGYYFSRNVLSQSNEYRISMYRDFVYIGVFFDVTLFEGTGRDLKGAQFGFVGGPTARVLLLDHFEFYFHYSWDYLLSTKGSRQQMHFNIVNKW
ncbi:MAG: hypothetical protein JW807_04880 [Spirochaetes bacterium]|nr:hypothetical protein [Spirochaetota bacterium]